MSAFDIYIYSIGAFAVIASILMRWPKQGDDHKHESPLTRQQTKE
jgi:hypothetical protein